MNRLTIAIVFGLYCQFSLGAPPSDIPCGNHWINIHEGNPDLVGVLISQYSTHGSEHDPHYGKHPAGITFVFRDKRMHRVGYSPSGQVVSGEWRELENDEYQIPDEEWEALLEFMHTDLDGHTSCSWWLDDAT